MLPICVAEILRYPANPDQETECKTRAQSVRDPCTVSRKCQQKPKEDPKMSRILALVLAPAVAAR
jgi:hypothetical protein